MHYHTGTTGAKITVNEVKLKGRGDLSLACDWGVGIGGGLWSTGLLLIEHLCTHAALYDEALRDRRVLELGSGTGLVGERSKNVMDRCMSLGVWCMLYMQHSPTIYFPSPGGSCC